MNRQNQNILIQEYDEQMTQKYQEVIQDGNLIISGDSDITSLKFIEKFNIQTLKLSINDSIKLQSKTIKELTIQLPLFQEEQILNLNIDDLELENLEVLLLNNNNLENDQLNNLSKFKKLRNLDVSCNNVDLTHLHNVTSLTKLSMQACGLQNIEQITSLLNLKDLDLKINRDIDICPLYQLISLTKLNIQSCNLKQIDKIGQLINLQVLDLSDNLLQHINSISRLVNLKELNIMSNEGVDITPLGDLPGLVSLDLESCGLKQLSALKPLVNLQFLDVSFNSNINISDLCFLRSLTNLLLVKCDLVSIYALKSLVNLEILNISYNNIVYLDVVCNMTNLQELSAYNNKIQDFTLEQLQNCFTNKNNGFNIQNQKQPTKNEILSANKFRAVERAFEKRFQIYLKRKTIQKSFEKFKLKINVAVKETRENNLGFICSAAQLFEQNQFVSQ
ncbi:leucine-rich_repeat domain-containing protein [Hexamita inflata]|uniref:Leucine-rich repeat domain-containing protein n=1 Tax=Hexamita inflata TaxID=28002 RepID=A0AA86U886_9EUKA|nr:leucine-rich repeat domain-containing protein [Hexamita inflata]